MFHQHPLYIVKYNLYRKCILLWCIPSFKCPARITEVAIVHNLLCIVKHNTIFVWLNTLSSVKYACSTVSYWSMYNYLEDVAQQLSCRNWSNFTFQRLLYTNSLPTKEIFIHQPDILVSCIVPPNHLMTKSLHNMTLFCSTVTMTNYNDKISYLAPILYNLCCWLRLQTLNKH